MLDLIFKNESQPARERKSLCLNLSYPTFRLPAHTLIKVGTKDVLLPVTWRMISWYNLRKNRPEGTSVLRSHRNIQWLTQTLYSISSIF